MQMNLALPLYFRRALQGLAQNLALDGELIGVIGVLIVASATTLKIRTERGDALGRWCKNVFQSRANESLLFFDGTGLDRLTRENKGDKNGFATRRLALGFIGLCFVWIDQPRQAIPAVDQLFNSQLHADRLHEDPNLVETQHATSPPSTTYRTGSSVEARRGRAIVCGHTACATAP